MAEIKESRQLKINDRIVTLPDIQKLSLFIFKEFEAMKSNSDYASASFIATCDDQSVFESEEPNLFDDNSVISTKSVKKIDISCLSLRPNHSVSITIVHGNNSGYFDSEIIVRGVDTNWVNGTLKRIEEIVDSFTPQYNYVSRHWVIMLIVFSVSIGAIMLHLMSAILPYVSTPEPQAKSGFLIRIISNYPFMRYPVLYLFCGFFGFVPAGVFMEKLSKLWPSIELQVGPEHKLIEKRRRAWIVGAFLLGVIPMIVQLIYDIAKHFI